MFCCYYTITYLCHVYASVESPPQAVAVRFQPLFFNIISVYRHKVKGLRKPAFFLVTWFFFRQLRMLRLEFAGRKVYHGGNSSTILKSVFCGAVFYFAVGQLWHTNRLFRVLCARRALSRCPSCSFLRLLFLKITQKRCLCMILSDTFKGKC